VYWSDLAVVEVPPLAVVNVTSTAAGKDALERFVVGERTVIEVPVELTVNEVVWTPPNDT